MLISVTNYRLVSKTSKFVIIKAIWILKRTECKFGINEIMIILMYMYMYVNKVFIFHILPQITVLTIGTVTAEKYIDVDGYIKYDAVSVATSNQLRGAEQVLEFSFRYCHDPGMLIYQEGGNSAAERDLFFALGVNQGKLYLEWKVDRDSLVEVNFHFCIFFLSPPWSSSNSFKSSLFKGCETFTYLFFWLMPEISCHFFSLSNANNVLQPLSCKINNLHSSSGQLYWILIILYNLMTSVLC